MQQESNILPTTGTIARRLGVPESKVRYVLKTRGIQHIGWAGSCRVYSEPAVAEIAAALREIAMRLAPEGGSDAI